MSVINAGAFRAPLGYARRSRRGTSSRQGAVMRNIAREQSVAMGMSGAGLGGSGGAARLCTGPGGQIAQALIGAAGGITSTFANGGGLSGLGNISASPPPGNFDTATQTGTDHGGFSFPEKTVVAPSERDQRVRRAGAVMTTVSDAWGRACTARAGGDPAAAYAQQQAEFAAEMQRQREQEINLRNGGAGAGEEEILGMPKKTFYLAAGVAGVLAGAVILLR